MVLVPKKTRFRGGPKRVGSEGVGANGANGENGGVRGSGCKVAKKQTLKGRN